MDKAVFPLPFVRENKFWPSVKRLDEVYGDRNQVRSNNGDSKFGEDRETMFSILDRHTQALKKAFYKHIS